jgi:single-strand DNA-binding protein
MPNFAHAQIIGHIGTAPVTKKVGQDINVVNFSVATSKKRAQEETTTWWNCSVFGKRGDVIMKFFQKGDAILVVGEPSLRKYTSAKGEGTSLELVVSDFSFVGGKSGTNSSFPLADSSSNKSAAQRKVEPEVFDEDIPF